MKDNFKKSIGETGKLSCLEDQTKIQINLAFLFLFTKSDYHSWLLETSRMHYKFPGQVITSTKQNENLTLAKISRSIVE